MQRLWADLRFALRSLLRAPSFSVFAVLALALGIGANTAIFSLVDAILLRPMQFREPSRLVQVWEDLSSIGFPFNTPAPANALDWKERNHSFQDVSVLYSGILNITGSSGAPEEVQNADISPNLLQVLGVDPLLGRGIRPEEAHPDPAHVALISYGLWMRRFGSDRNILGRSISLDREPYEIIGVMPRGFRFPESIDIWRPIRFRFQPGQSLSRGNHFLRVFARLKPGVTVEDAQRDLEGITAQLGREHPEDDANVGVRVVGLRDDFMRGRKLGIYVLMWGVGALLLISCANVAGLQLARATGRSREFAVRAAIGAGRADLLRQSLAENVVLACVGSAFGLLLAVWAIPFLNHLVPEALAGWTHPELNTRVLLFTFFVSIASVLMFGSLPALASSQVDVSQALQAGGRTGIGAHSRARSYLVTGEVAIAAVLLTGALLLAQTLWNLSRVPLGFNPEHVLTARTSLPLSPQSPYSNFQQRELYYTRVIEQIQRIHGVASAGFTTFLPLTNEGGSSGFEIAGAPKPKPGEYIDANHRVVTPQFLQTLGVPLKAGRYFDWRDRMGSEPVMIVNEAMARRYFGGRNPIGQKVHLTGNITEPWMTVVGMVGDVRQMGVDVEGRPEMYMPYTQEATSIGFYTPRDLAIRVEGDPMRYADAVRRAIWSVDSAQPIVDMQAMQTIIDEKLAPRLLQMQLICGFALMAILLAALGLYGLLALSVLGRTREIGVRMALGAEKGRILRDTLTSGLRLIGAGLGIGLLIALLGARLIQSMLYGVSSENSLTFCAAAAILLVCGLVACYLPARRAASVDPMEALRYE